MKAQQHEAIGYSPTEYATAKDLQHLEGLLTQDLRHLEGRLTSLIREQEQHHRAAMAEMKVWLIGTVVSAAMFVVIMVKYIP